MLGLLVLRCFFTFAALFGASVVLEHCLVTWLVVHRGFDRGEEARHTRMKISCAPLRAVGKLFEKKRLQYYFSDIFYRLAFRSL